MAETDPVGDVCGASRKTRKQTLSHRRITPLLRSRFQYCWTTMMVVTGAKMTSESQVVEINRIVRLPDHFDRLLSEAAAEGFNNLSVLRDEWQDGTNRFERPGEILALATINGELAGIGGITQDFVEKDWLRMRRFYVRQRYRRLGVGRKIALFVLAYARPFHRRIALYAGGPEAEAFWPTLGFVPIDREHTTHVHGDIAW